MQYGICPNCHWGTLKIHDEDQFARCPICPFARRISRKADWRGMRKEQSPKKSKKSQPNKSDLRARLHQGLMPSKTLLMDDLDIEES